MLGRPILGIRAAFQVIPPTEPFSACTGTPASQPFMATNPGLARQEPSCFPPCPPAATAPVVVVVVVAFVIAVGLGVSAALALADVVAVVVVVSLLLASPRFSTSATVGWEAMTGRN